ncbi:MAG: hypothetical protein ACI9ON_003246 [Limisphaerales bacterium]|jgi:hypothetical protein
MLADVEGDLNTQTPVSSLIMTAPMSYFVLGFDVSRVENSLRYRPWTGHGESRRLLRTLRRYRLGRRANMHTIGSILHLPCDHLALREQGQNNIKITLRKLLTDLAGISDRLDIVARRS